MVLVHEPGYYTGHRASAWSPQYNCRPRIPNNEGPVRLDVETHGPAEMWSTGIQATSFSVYIHNLMFMCDEENGMKLNIISILTASGTLV